MKQRRQLAPRDALRPLTHPFVDLSTHPKAHHLRGLSSSLSRVVKIGIRRSCDLGTFHGSQPGTFAGVTS